MSQQNMDETSVLDLNQTVANENDEEVRGELEGNDTPEGTTLVSGVSFDHATGNGFTLKLSVPGDGDSILIEDHAASPSKKSSHSHTRQTPSPSTRLSNRESRSPSPKRRRSSPAFRKSFSRSPEERCVHSRSPEGRHARKSDDGRRRHDRFRSSVRRSHDRERSRSWSPRDRDRHRSRYSPRRRSSPSRYSMGDHSPRKCPWSPPRNRNTGLGKPGNNLFIAGFSFQTTERDLEKKFGRYGRVSDVRIIRDRRSGDSRGFGFLSLERDEEADAAIEGLDQTEWNGRIVLVEKAKTTSC